jgi:hypothetical protein
MNAKLLLILLVCLVFIQESHSFRLWNRWGGLGMGGLGWGRLGWGGPRWSRLGWGGIGFNRFFREEFNSTALNTTTETLMAHASNITSNAVIEDISNAT